MTELISASRVEEDDLRSRHVIHAITPTDELFDSWLLLRQQFVEAQGWHFGPDFDGYDSDPSTVQLVNVNDDGVIEAGMRLTPRESIEETMTWSWAPLHLQAAARRNMPEVGAVWDLTRLVPGRVNSKDPLARLVELFGAGYDITKNDHDPAGWVFATSVPFCRHLGRHGLHFTPLVQGKFSADDRHESILCHVNPAECAEFLEVTENEHLRMMHLAVEQGRTAWRLGGYRGDK